MDFTERPIGVGIAPFFDQYLVVSETAKEIEQRFIPLTDVGVTTGYGGREVSILRNNLMTQERAEMIAKTFIVLQKIPYKGEVDLKPFCSVIEITDGNVLEHFFLKKPGWYTLYITGKQPHTDEANLQIAGDCSASKEQAVRNTLGSNVPYKELDDPNEFLNVYRNHSTLRKFQFDPKGRTFQ